MMRTEKIEFTSDRHRLVSDLYLPEPGTERGAVVLTGPFSGYRRR